jgi:hypothetical protein
MIFPAENRLFRTSMAAFTALAVMVGFCFMAGEAPRTLECAAAKTGGGMVESFIPSPAEEPAILTKTEELQPVSPAFERLFISCGTRGGASAFYQAPGRASSNTGGVNIKNRILLKLRI